MKKYTEPIYKHTHLDMKVVNKLKPLMESAFANELSKLNERPDIKAERVQFMAEQFANRCRVANNLGHNSPLFEDANIFGHLDPSIKPMFESYSMPGNITSSGDIVNPTATSTLAGQTWNPAAKSGSGDAGSHVFGLQSHIALLCAAFDLVPMIAVDTPKVITNFVDEIYGGGDLDSDEALPSFLKFGNAGVINYEFIKTNGLVRGKSKLVFAASTGEAIEVLFILGSTEDPTIVAQVLSTGEFTPGTAPAVGTYVAGDLADLTVADALEAINADATPVILHEDATSTMVETAMTVGALTIGYTSATRTNIIEATTNTGERKGMHRKQHKKGPKFKINLVSLDKSIEMVGLEIDADTDNLQIKDFAALGVNVISRLYNSVHNAILQSLDEIILDHLYAMGVQHAQQAYEASGINHSLYIGRPSSTDKAMTDFDAVYENMMGEDVRSTMGVVENSILSSQYENQTTHADRLFARILLVGEFIGFQNRIGEPDYILAGGTVLAALKKAKNYTIVPTENTLSSGPELNYTGSIMGMRVYRNNKTSFNDCRVLIGRRGNDSDPGTKFLAYDLASSAQTTAEGTMSAKIRVWSRFNLVDVGFHPELNYYTFLVHNDSAWA